MIEKRDETMPTGAWQFDESVTDAFDNMLARSIPQCDVMRDAVFSFGKPFVQPKTDVVDIGCSRGNALQPFVDEFWPLPTDRRVHRFLGVEISDPMIAAATARFKGHIANGAVEIVKHDLRSGYPFCRASLTLSVFTLQFVPIEYRQRVVQDIFDHTVYGGALILVEKVLGATARIDKLLVDRYYEMKESNGYSHEAIERKRLSLEGVLVPVTADWNVELLRQAGFRQIDSFWRCYNFAGWIAIKG